MALTYGFYNSVGGDRKYDAEQMSSVFDGVINDGVFPTVGEKFAVKVSTGLTVTVAPGRAWFNRTWTYLDVAMPLTVGAAHPTLPRIDAVVLEVDKRDDVRANSIKIIAGTADSAPQKPSLSSSGDVYQHALAYITVPAGATTLVQGNIEYVVGLSGCPYVTSVVETTDIDALFAQWDDQFNTWFDNVQAQLEGNVATNLQNQIDELKNVRTIPKYDLTERYAVHSKDTSVLTVGPDVENDSTAVYESDSIDMLTTQFVRIAPDGANAYVVSTDYTKAYRIDTKLKTKTLLKTVSSGSKILAVDENYIYVGVALGTDDSEAYGRLDKYTHDGSLAQSCTAGGVGTWSYNSNDGFGGGSNYGQLLNRFKYVSHTANYILIFCHSSSQSTSGTYTSRVYVLSKSNGAIYNTSMSMISALKIFTAYNQNVFFYTLYSNSHSQPFSYTVSASAVTQVASYIKVGDNTYSPTSSSSYLDTKIYGVLDANVFLLTDNYTLGETYIYGTVGSDGIVTAVYQRNTIFPFTSQKELLGMYDPMVKDFEINGVPYPLLSSGVDPTDEIPMAPGCTLASIFPKSDDYYSIIYKGNIYASKKRPIKDVQYLEVAE